MTYFKLNIRLIIADVIVFLLYILAYMLIFLKFSEITAAFPILLFATLLLVDGITLYILKGDLLSNKYKGTVSYIVFMGRQIIDLIVGVILMVVGIVFAFIYGIAIE